MSRFVCWVAQLIISFMLFWLLVSLRDNHCEVLCHLVDISGEEHMVDSKEQTPLSSSTAGYWTARGGGTRNVSCYDLQHATTEWWMSTPKKKSQGVLAFVKAGCNAKDIFLVRIFVLVFQYWCLNILKMRFTLDAKLHEILIVFMFIFMIPLAVNINLT